MSRLARVLLCLSFLLALAPTGVSAQTPTLPTNCAIIGTTLPVTLVCTPTVKWNGDLVVFAHGYVAPGSPPTAGFEQLVTSDGQFLPKILTRAGYAFATSSYSKDGLAVIQGVQDTLALVSQFKLNGHAPRNVYLVGASEGGLVTTLAVEQYPAAFAGGLAVCGPIGDFRGQINYLGDFRVIFDYFFPTTLPRAQVGTAINVLPAFAQNWGNGATGFSGAIAGSVLANPNGASSQLFAVTRAATDPNVPATAAATAVQVLWYSAFATMDARDVLTGQPYSNVGRWYFGSRNDWLLNRLVPRYLASPSALSALRAYQTTGRLQKPLVTMHTLLDPVVPYWHEPMYTLRAIAAGSGARHINIPIARYGHCSFTSGELLGGFVVLGLMSSSGQATAARAALPSDRSRDDFDRILREHGKR
jgi:pimeloyl-ACP methyl ester carboxylesterase